MNLDKPIIDLKQNVVSFSDKTQRLSCVCFCFHAGNFYENSSTFSATHLIEHLVYKTLIENKGLQKIESLGCIMNANTLADQVRFYLIAPTEHIYQSVDIFLDSFCNVDFSPDNLQEEKQVVLRELSEYSSNIQKNLTEKLIGSLLKPDTALLLKARKPHIDRLNRGATRIFYKEMLNLEKAHLLIIGGCDPARVLSVVNKYRRRVDRSKHTHSSLESSNNYQSESYNIQSTESYIGLAIDWGAPYTPSYLIGELLNYKLSNRLGSELYQELRFDNSLVYTVTSDLISYTNQRSIFLLSTHCKREHTRQVLDILNSELIKIKNQSIGDLAGLKRQLLTRYYLTVSSITSLISWLTPGLLYESLYFFTNYVNHLEEIEQTFVDQTLYNMIQPDKIKRVIFTNERV